MFAVTYSLIIESLPSSDKVLNVLAGDADSARDTVMKKARKDKDDEKNGKNRKKVIVVVKNVVLVCKVDLW